MFAIVVQTLLPFVVAADITATAGAPPICSGPSGDRRDNDRHDSGRPCPICAALAAATTITTPAPPALPLPRFAGAVIAVAASQAAPDLHPVPYYRSRAPPIV
ncbi:MAG TPA: DUF2946 family protein [Stellaceae bacterium]|nr:DUF2946 family protein [Stellaceae bacterium]